MRKHQRGEGCAEWFFSVWPQRSWSSLTVPLSPAPVREYRRTGEPRQMLWLLAPNQACKEIPYTRIHKSPQRPEMYWGQQTQQINNTEREVNLLEDIFTQIWKERGWNINIIFGVLAKLIEVSFHQLKEYKTTEANVLMTAYRHVSDV